MIIKKDQSIKNSTCEIVLPSSLYKINKNNFEKTEITEESLLTHKYTFPKINVLNDWIFYLDAVFNEIYAVHDLCQQVIEKITKISNVSLLTCPEIIITIYTWSAILSETKTLIESEQSYMTALLIIHKVYGDPRGRGSVSVPWELFICWRLSIINRLQSKINDAEYVEELFDAIVLGLKYKENDTHYTYNNPFYPYSYNYNEFQYNKNLFKNSEINFEKFDYPLTHWSKHLIYDEKHSMMEVLNSTFPKSEKMFKWVLEHLPLWSQSKIIWEASNLDGFFFSIMQNAFSGGNRNNSVSSPLSDNLNMDRLNSNDSIDLQIDNKMFMPEKQKKTGNVLRNNTANLKQIFERDYSTFSKKEILGIPYVWGQNTDGQLGIVDAANSQKKMKIFNPRLLISLKDAIVTNLACGLYHILAITITGNKSGQLGFGENSQNVIHIPTLIPKLNNIIQVSCGSEHSVALDQSKNVYSWGQGAGGLLGHGDTISQYHPKVIEMLKNMQIENICCGGLHTIALAKQGILYSWGRGEGGQLGLPFNLLTKTETGDIYLTTPKRIRSVLEGCKVKQVACGALLENGQVYGWGYTNCGQLGLGINSDNEIFSGATFSMFLNDKKELYCCGINDYNQLGIDKNPYKMGVTIAKNSNKNLDIPIPKKMEIFNGIPILSVSCGENHSLAVGFNESKNYTLFAWGMNKQGQLGLGEQSQNTIAQNSSFPKPIGNLQDMGLGAYHSIIIIGSTNNLFKSEKYLPLIIGKIYTKLNFCYFNFKVQSIDNKNLNENFYTYVLEFSLRKAENIDASDNYEAKIDNSKEILELPYESQNLYGDDDSENHFKLNKPHSLKHEDKEDSDSLIYEKEDSKIEILKLPSKSQDLYDNESEKHFKSNESHSLKFEDKEDSDSLKYEVEKDSN